MSEFDKIRTRKLGKTIQLLLGTVVILSLGFTAIWIQPASALLSSWSSTTNYPIGIEFPSCVMSSGFVYCIAGDNSSSLTNAVYFAPLLPAGGAGSWSSSTSYPLRLQSQSCVTSSGYVYCIGGDTHGGLANSTSAVYFAALSSNGVGSWLPSTRYPTNIAGQSCVVDSGFVYCIAGENTTALPGGGVQGTINSAVYFAPLSSSGVGSWSPTTSYPTGIVFQSCVVDSGFVYCIGGDMANGFGTANGFTNVVYFAPLSSSGVGSWSSATSYPLNVISPSCVVGSGFAYCIGGDTATHSPFGGTFTGFTSAVYFASLSSSGVGSWASTTSYPTVIYTQSCALDSGFVYCIGGNNGSGVPSGTWSNGVFFASTSPNTTSTSISCSPSSVAVNQPTQCTATVTDTSSTPAPIIGTVTFSSSSSGSFTPSNTCTLKSIGSSTASCAATVSYAPGSGTEGTQTITGTYDGDHQGSSGTTSLTVTERTTSTMVTCPKVKGNTVCTVTVTDTSPGTAITPAGTVAMSSTGSGMFTSCNLSGTGSSATCTATYTTGRGKTTIITIMATYSGDKDHFGSSGNTTIKSS